MPPARRGSAPAGSRIAGGTTLSMTISKNEEAQEKAAKLRAFAADLRAQAEELEAERDVERRQAAQKAFDSFDSNEDGEVGVKELIAGLEGQLKRDFVKRMTKRMGRKPTESEIADKISEMPGGVLLPVELGKKLVEIYDTNKDGVLQREEFVPKEDIRLRLEALFADRAQEERMRAAEARTKEIEERGAQKMREAAKARGLALPEDFNDGPPDALDRLVCVVPYLLPLMDSLVFGQHIFLTYPEQLSVFGPLVAGLLLYRSLPFSTLILFFALNFYASRPEVNKLVRYNFRQAIDIDIAMFFPSILGFAAQLALGPAGAEKFASIGTAASDVIFVTVIISIVYSIVSSAFGIIPDKLPSLVNREGSRFVQKDDRADDKEDDKKP